jgi:Polyketide cyclase / dehydrase and lipid transport
MRGGIVGDVGATPARRGELLAWEPFAHIAFRLNEASTGSIAAFAEDYRIEPTESGCQLTWVMAMKPNGVAGRLGTTAGRPVMSWLFQKFLYNLRDYSTQRFPAAAQ